MLRSGPATGHGGFGDWPVEGHGAVEAAAAFCRCGWSDEWENRIDHRLSRFGRLKHGIHTSQTLPGWKSVILGKMCIRPCEMPVCSVEWCSADSRSTRCGILRMWFVRRAERWTAGDPGSSRDFSGAGGGPVSAGHVFFRFPVKHGSTFLSGVGRNCRSFPKGDRAWRREKIRMPCGRDSF